MTKDHHGPQTPSQSHKSWRKLAVAVGGSVLVHGTVIGTIWGIRSAKVADPVAEMPVVFVEIAKPELPEKEPDPAPEGDVSQDPTPAQEAQTQEAAKAPVVKPNPRPVAATRVHRTPAPVMPTEVVEITPSEAMPTMRLLGDDELAGAIVAGASAGGGQGQGGSGGGGSGGSGQGGACDMAGRLQALVRRDTRIQSAVRQAQQSLGAGRRAIQIWDGDWVQSQGQAGRGLAGVRQAIAVEVAFASRECRHERVNGLVVLTLGDDAASPRLALGTQSWRWGELAVR